MEYKESTNIDERNKYSFWFLIIAIIYLTCLLTSNIISVKVITLFGLIMPAGTIIFPVSYIVGDVLTEVYGYSRTRPVIWLGFGANLLMTIIIGIAIALPSAPFWDGQEAYTKILGFTPRLLVASLFAYLLGEFTNSYVLAKMKIATKGKWLWTRTIGSTLVGEFLDSLIFVTIAFFGIFPPQVIVSMIFTQWLIKSGYEILATPLTYAVVGFLKRKEGREVFDTNTNFNPFLIAERR